MRTSGSFFRGFLSALVCGAVTVPLLVLGGGVLEAQVSRGGGGGLSPAVPTEAEALSAMQDRQE